MDANRFFDTLSTALACDRARSEALSSVVFQQLRDRLTEKEAADVAAQLPRELSRLWWEGETTAPRPQKIHAAELIGRVRRGVGLPDDDQAERAVRAVFANLRLLLGSPTGLDGEAWDVFSVLPKDMKRLWLSEAEDGVTP